jgi:hypothetical protein
LCSPSPRRQIAIVIPWEPFQKFVASPPGNVFAKKVLEGLDVTDVNQDGLIIPTVNLATAQALELTHPSVTPKVANVLVTIISEPENAPSVPRDSTAIQIA